MHALTYGSMHTCWVYLRYFGLAYIFSRVSNNKGGKIHKYHAILVEKQVINNNTINKNIYTKLKGVQIQVCVKVRRYQEFKVSSFASCLYFQPRWFPNGILRDKGHITTWIAKSGRLPWFAKYNHLLEQLSQKLRPQVWRRTTTPKNIDSSSCHALKNDFMMRGTISLRVYYL
jgi:hypothetical protein